METITSLRNHVIDQLEKDIISAENGIKYCNEMIKKNNINKAEAWINKEYECVKQDRIDKLDKMKIHLEYLKQLPD